MAFTLTTLSCVYLACSQSPAGSSQDWARASLFGLQSTVGEAHAADFDGDGDLDLYFVTTDHQRLVWAENFDGTGRSSAVRTIGAVNGVARESLVEDLDGDGDLDVMVAPRVATDDRPLLWFENRGSGQFAIEPRSIGDRDRPVSGFARADVDDDGLLDVVTMEVGFRLLMWRRNLGLSNSGSYGSSEVVPGGVSDAKSMVAVDLDDDGRRDLLVLHGGPSIGARITTVLWAQPGGGFDRGADMFHGIATYRPKFGDLDGDGRDDLFTIDESSGTTREILWARNEGSRTFSSTSIVATLPGALSTNVGWTSVEDLDRDGDPEVLVSVHYPTDHVRFAAFEHTGGGSFSASEPLEFLGDAPALVREVADLNGDGFSDIIEFENTYPEVPPRVLVNGGGLQFERPELIHAPGGRLTGHVVLDLDGDSDEDIIHVAGKGSWFENLRDGQFALPRSVTGVSMHHLANARVVDLDGDGDDDLIGTRSSSPVLIENLGGGEFAARVGLDTSTIHLGSHDVLDVDGDGLMDVVGTGHQNRVLWRSHGGFNYGAPEPLPGPSSIPGYGAIWADIDGDGQDDWITTRSPVGSNGQIVVARNRTVPGGPFDFEFGPTRQLHSSLSIVRLRASDGDGDGDLDVMVLLIGSGGAPVAAVEWLESVDGELQPSRTLVRIDEPAKDALMLDSNGDSLPDVVVMLGTLNPWSTADIVQYVHSGSGNSPTRKVVAAGLDFSNWLHAHDFDLDGDVDLYFVGDDSGWVENLQHFGVNECGPAPVNSAGLSAEISVGGSRLVADNDFELTVTGLPPGVFGIFLAAQSDGFVPNPGGSAGNLCLGGSIGRQTGPGQILGAGMTGEFSLALDLTSVTTPTGPTAVASGETWWFQAWYRDGASSAGSNFSDAVRVGFK